MLTGDVRRVNVIEGEPSDRQMTTGNHTVRDIYCCKCGTILGWKYVSIAFLLGPLVYPLTILSFGRTKHMNNHRSTRKESTFSSVTSSSTCNSRISLERVHISVLLAVNTSPFFGNHISDLLGPAFSLTCGRTHKRHLSKLASASLHPHVVIEFSLAPTPSHYHFPDKCAATAKCMAGDSSILPRFHAIGVSITS